MYAWIWRHLPFGRPGKIIGSLCLVLAAVALLWYVVFPWAEPLAPFDDVQVTQEDGDSGSGGEDPGSVVGPEGASTSPTPSSGPSISEFDIPYPTHTNNPEPNASGSGR